MRALFISVAFCLVLFLAAAFPAGAGASVPNRVYRVEIRPGTGYTRINLHLSERPSFSVSLLPDNRLRLTLQDTEGPLFRRYRRYSDRNIGGLAFSRCGDSLQVTFRVAPGTGWNEISPDGTNDVTLRVGAGFAPQPPRCFIPGREPIWNGVEKLVRDFDPPMKTEIPFQPTDRQVLKNILDDNDQALFLAAEAALYKGSLTEAEELFSRFASRQAPIRPLALYRLGEVLYKLQKYPQALAAFREAERLWPAYITFNPGVTFYYGDSIARSGDLASARILLARLIARLADKSFAPALLVRLADILSRQSHDQEALAIYRNVAEHFADNKGSKMARMRLADRDFFRVSPWDYRRLGDVYLEISRQGADADIREEALFKHVLLSAMHGPAFEALQGVMQFQKRFPRSVYATVLRNIREVLVAQVFRETTWDKDAAGLIRFVEEQQQYLAGCLGQQTFLPSVTRAYDEAARPIELIKLYNAMLEHPWAAASAPYLYEEIAYNADLIGDYVTAQNNLRTFVRKYPAHPRVRQVLERLGAICFARQEYQNARDALVWLLRKGESARQPESYYYLGRSLWELKDFAQAAKAMDAYILAVTGSEEKLARTLLPDAYFISASARLAAGDRKGALRTLAAAIKLPDNNRSDEFLYRAGEISILEGNRQAARAYFDQVARSGRDADWRRLAQQALASYSLGAGR
jgi:TolA-binding protein